MRDEPLEALAALDTDHWIYQARAERIADVFESVAADRPSILDVGCGPGGTTMVLARHGEVTAVDPSPVASTYVHRRIPSARFLQATVDDIDDVLAGEVFDVVTCFGALNQRSVVDPARSIARLADRTAAGGFLLLDEPADRRLHRHMDIVSDTARRFDLDDLRAMVEATGLEVVEARYLHGWGWPVARAIAFRERLRPKPLDQLPGEMSGLFDRPAYRFTRIERALSARGRTPRRGTGCWLVARRPG